MAQGLAMRDALVADLSALPGVELCCVVGEGVPLPAAGRMVTGRARESLPELLARESARYDRVWVIAPESDGCLSALAQAVDRGRWIGCLPEAIELCGSKRATLAHLAARGVVTPLAFMAEASGWIVKPDDGAGSVDTRVHGTRQAAERDLSVRLARGRRATLEPWVQGEPLSLSLLAGGPGRNTNGGRGGDASSVDLLGVNRQRIEVDPAGTLAYRGVDILAIGATDARHAALRDVAAAVVQAVPGLRGFVGIDLVWHATRGPVVIEINPRLTCAYAGLSAGLGRNVAGEVLAMHEEVPAHA